MALTCDRKLEATPDSGELPRTLTLSFALHTDQASSKADVTYSLADSHAYYFDHPGGVLCKRFTTPAVPVSARPTGVERRVTIVPHGKADRPPFFFATAIATEAGTGDKFQTSAQINVET